MSTPRVPAAAIVTTVPLLLDGVAGEPDRMTSRQG